MKYSTFNGIIFLFAVAFFGIGLRTFENGNYTGAGFAGMGIAATVVYAVIQVRNHADRKAVAKKG